MNDLQGLVHYANPQRLKRIKFLKKKRSGRDTYVDRFYDALVNNEVKDDESASQYLYGRTKDTRYYRLKSKLRDRLINAVLLTQTPNQENGLKYNTLQIVRKEFLAAEALWGENYPATAYEMFRRVLKLSLKAELTEMIVPVAARMRNYANLYLRNSKYFNKYDKLHEKWKHIYEGEEELKSIYDLLFFHYSASQVANEKVTELLDVRYRNCIEKYGDVRTVTFLFYRSFIELAEAGNSQRYQKVIEIAWEGYGAMKDNPIAPRGYKRLLLLQVIGATLRFENFQEGRKAMNEYMEIVDEGSVVWFRGYQLYLYLCIQAREFTTAVQVMNTVFSHPKFKSLREALSQNLFLLRAYLDWLISTGNVDPGAEILHKFRFGRFLNETPDFAKDKQGLNIPVLIIQGLWKMHDGKYGEARGRFENLERYGNRHLRNAPGLKRTYYFIKLICQLPKANFHRAAFERKSARFLKALGDTPRAVDQQGLEAEIIPYEEFYKYILNVLDNQLH